MRQKTSFYRLLLSVVVVLAAACSLFPIHDRPFKEYITSCVTHNKTEFGVIIERAQARIESGESKTLYLAIRDIANSENIDLSEFFKNKNVADIKNITKKNKILLDTILADSKSRIKQGLDLKGGISCVLKVDDEKFEKLGFAERTEQLNKAIEIIRQRIDGLGVSEPLVRIFGNNCIEVQLPGVSTKDNPEIVDVIKKPAKLEFRLLHPTMKPKSKNDRPVIGYEILAIERENNESSKQQEDYAFVKKLPEMTGSAVKRAGVIMGQYGEYEISLTMTEEGAKRFEKVTSANINRQLGIVLDGKLYSAPFIRSAIPNGHASISGNFSQRDAFELANVLNNPLEVELKFVELNEIGPSLAEDSKASSMQASLIGAAVVLLFIAGYYHVAGLISLISVLANVAIVFGVMVGIGATLTLPGIAALVLTIGMAVDANILIFERMREELLEGKTLEASLLAGHEKAFSTILDANLTTLLTAAILAYFGTGPIKGFGIILSIGIFATMFCALVLCRGMLEIVVKNNLVKKLIPDFRVKLGDFDFLKHMKTVFVVYGLFVVTGIVALLFRDSRVYGIDFTGGDEITVTFEKKIPINEINKLAAENNIGEIVSVYQKSITEDAEVLRIQTAEGKSTKFFEKLQGTHADSHLSLIKKTEIGSSVGKGIKLNALISVLLSMLGIMIYVAFRFEIGYGIGAVVSTVLDVVMTVVIYLSIGRQISAPMVASILMVIGYSINDTIIVFDRIREELRANKTKFLKEIINLSISQTLARTVLTSTTTFLAALALYLFGSGVIVDFALVFLIGIAVGTFSSIFIASPIFFIWHKGDRKTIANAGI